MVLKDFICDLLHVRVFETREAMGKCAGEEAAACIKELLSQQEEVQVMFAAAPSQDETLATLLHDPDIDWSRVNAFHMDEYVGLDANHPARFANYLHRNVFTKKTFRSINLLQGNASDAQAEADRYAALLQEKPLDVCILGIGENGHIAFNDPPVADFADPSFVKIVELEERCRMQQVNDGCFAAITDVPTHALTVTIPGLMQARHMICSVPAATKAEAVYNVVHNEISTDCPATILRTHADARLYTDRDAGKRLL